MSKTVLVGKGSSPGIAIGEVYHWKSESAVPHCRISRNNTAGEKRRLAQAFHRAKDRWEQNLEQLSRLRAREQRAILQSHLMILLDPVFFEMGKEHIEKARINAEWAVELTGQHLSVSLAGTDSSASFKRNEDIQAVVHHILHHLVRKKPLWEQDRRKLENKILLTDTLTPDMLLPLKRLRIAGFATRLGGPNSHTMILARALGIPAVSGVEDLHARLAPRQTVILNGFEGKLLLSPAAAELAHHRALFKKHSLLERLLLAEARLPAITRDRQAVRVEANLELPEEVAGLAEYGAEGIGLFRTESLFWDFDQIPSESKQYRWYAQILAKAKKFPVTFRTMDVDGDLWLGRPQPNPALGLRGIRFSLRESHLLRQQLRALLKAAAAPATKAPCRLLLPMVSQLEEIDLFRELLEQERRALAKAGVRIPARLPLGMMIEVPAAALLIDRFAPAVDFFAIGSNDLIQYTLAVDRTHEAFGENDLAYHPAIFQLLFHIVQNCRKTKKPVYLCGELGGDPLFIPVLLGLGIRHFSMNPLSIPRAKKLIRSLSVAECRRQVRRMMGLSRGREIAQQLKALRLQLDTPWWPD